MLTTSAEKHDGRGGQLDHWNWPLGSKRIHRTETLERRYVSPAFQIESIDNFPSIRAIGKWAGNSSCDVTRGTDGLQFHSDVRDNDRLDIFIGEFCRSFPFAFDQNEDFMGIKVKKFTMNSMYDSNTDDDRCYCTPNLDCDRDGIFDLGPCKQGAPIFISKPHFLGAPFYQTNITGLTPDFEKHEAWVKVEPWLGATLHAGVKFQVNIALINQTDMYAPFAPNLLPLLWLNAINDFGEDQVQKLDSILFSKITTLQAVGTTFIITGLLIIGAFLLYNRRFKGRWALFTD